MKHLKTFEYFNYGAPMGREEEEENVYMAPFEEEEEEITVPPYGEEEEEEGGCGCGPNCNCGTSNKSMGSMPMAWDSDEEEEEDEMMPADMEIMKFEAKKTSKKAKPDFIDLDKDGNKKESMKKAAADKKKAQSEKDSKDDKKSTKSSKGKLTKAQEKLPAGLKKAIAQGVRD